LEVLKDLLLQRKSLRGRPSEEDPGGSGVAMRLLVGCNRIILLAREKQSIVKMTLLSKKSIRSQVRIHGAKKGGIASDAH